MLLSLVTSMQKLVGTRLAMVKLILDNTVWVQPIVEMKCFEYFSCELAQDEMKSIKKFQ